MARFIPRHQSHVSAVKLSLGVAALAGWVCLAPVAFAQHGGGHAGGGMHSGGATHASAPHVSSPPASVPAPHFAEPARIPGPPAMGAGTRIFVPPAPVVHLIPPPGSPRPIMGGRLSSPIFPPAQIEPPPHTTIGFPPSAQIGAQAFVPGSGGLSFSGEGREVWQSPPGSAEGVRVDPADRDRIHIHPRPPGSIRPIRPIFPVFGGPFFGGPFLGFGLGFGGGWGFNSFWGPGCGPYWSGGFGCNAWPGYLYGDSGYYGNYDNTAPEDNAGGQPENQASAPYMYEYPAAPVYGGGQRDLVQLYLKNGTVYEVTDYWLVGDKLHFVTRDSNETQSEFMLDFDELDLQKTVDVNTQRGFRFVLRNEPLPQYLEEHEQTAPQNQSQPQGTTAP